MLAEGYSVTLEHQGSHWWYTSRRDLFLRQVRRATQELQSRDRPLSLLDYGCGSGFDLRFLAQFGNAEGADITGELAGAAPKYPVHLVPRDLPRLRGRFDVVTCLDVLEHLDDDIAGLRTIGSLLAPGGQVVVTVPAYDWLWSGEDVISMHRRRYTRRRLLDTACAAGMDVLYASYFNLSVLPAMTAVVWKRRWLNHDESAQSNLDAGPHWLQGIARAVTGLEARWVGEQHLPLPAGASLVCRLRRHNQEREAAIAQSPPSGNGAPVG
jgi:SAM-dependent methyltransferase